MEIIPREIYGDIHVLKSDDPGIERRYNEWKKGSCIEYIDGIAKK